MLSVDRLRIGARSIAQEAYVPDDQMQTATPITRRAPRRRAATTQEPETAPSAAQPEAAASASASGSSEDAPAPVRRRRTRPTSAAAADTAPSASAASADSAPATHPQSAASTEESAPAKRRTSSRSRGTPKTAEAAPALAESAVSVESTSGNSGFAQQALMSGSPSSAGDAVPVAAPVYAAGQTQGVDGRSPASADRATGSSDAHLPNVPVLPSQSGHGEGHAHGQLTVRRDGDQRPGRPFVRPGARPGGGQPPSSQNGQPPRTRFDRSNTPHGAPGQRPDGMRPVQDQHGGRGRPGQGDHSRDRRPMQPPAHGTRPSTPQRGIPGRGDRGGRGPANNRPPGYPQQGYIVPGYGVPGYGTPPYGGHGDRMQRPHQQRGRTSAPPAPVAPARTVEVKGVLWVRGNTAELLDERGTLAPLAQVSFGDVQRMGLRAGDLIHAHADERGTRRQVVAIDMVNNRPPEQARERPLFEQLTAISPRRRITLERGPRPLSARIIDLFSPLGFGARALVVAPPKTGKTTFLRETAESVLSNYPDVLVMACLVGERPEEVTDLRGALEPRGGLVYAASFDEPQERHAWLVQVTIERAKRVAEAGGNVVVLLDSLTRLARAENLTGRAMGRTLSGGIDAQALDTGRRAFGAARALEEGGSLTIMATCLVDTGSRQDDVVYEEFKGTGNMEIYLSRELSQRRLFPAVDAVRSGTRKEELLLTPEELRAATLLRRRLADIPLQAATTQLLNALERTPSNAQLILAVEQSPSLR